MLLRLCNKKKLMKILGILLILISWQLSFAQNKCEGVSVKPIDMSSSFGPIRNQDSIGWCYAHVAADMIGHHISNNGGAHILNMNPETQLDMTKKENMISANSIAINYNDRVFRNYYKMFKQWNTDDFIQHNSDARLGIKKKRSIWDIFRRKPNRTKEYEVVAEAGNTAASINITLRQTFCLEESMPSDDFNLVFGHESCNSKEAGGCELQALLRTIYDFEKDGQGGESWCKAEKAIKEMFPNMSINKIPNIMLESHRANIFNNLKDATCNYKFQPRKAPTAVEDRIDYETSCNDYFKGRKEGRCGFDEFNEELFVKLDEKLEQGQVVGIAYKSDFLQGREGHSSGGHASTIVGQRLNPETCQKEYILRNSWGPGCLQYQQEDPEVWDCTEKIPFSHSYAEVLLEEMRQWQANAGSSAEVQAAIAQIKRIEAIKSSGLISEARRKELEADCYEKHPRVMLNKSLSCKDGYLYIPKSELKKHMYGVTYFK